MGKKQEHSNSNYDTSIIRPQMSRNDVALRGKGLFKKELTNIKKGLLALHMLELMAQTIYKFQITKEQNELNRRLIAAMCNEMTHYQDFQVKLYEYGFRPGILRWAYWLVGCTLGFTSRLIGPKAILRVGIWVETKAVRHPMRARRGTRCSSPRPPGSGIWSRCSSIQRSTVITSRLRRKTRSISSPTKPTTNKAA